VVDKGTAEVQVNWEVGEDCHKKKKATKQSNKKAWMLAEVLGIRY
jgi:hypothetical protein